MCNASELGAETIARDKFYQSIIKMIQKEYSKKQLNPGVDPGQIGRPIFFKNYNNAVVNLPNQKITKHL